MLPKTILDYKKVEPVVLQLFFFIGFFLVIFSLLRFFSWDHRDLKIICGIGLVLILLGIDSHIKSKITSIGLAGSFISLLGLFLYYFTVNSASDELALLYAGGIAILITDIFATDFLAGFNQKILIAIESLRDDITASIKIKNDEKSNTVKDLTEMAVDVWRLEKRIQKIGSGLPENQIKSFENSLQRLKRIFTKMDFEVLDYTNMKYNEGLNLDIISIEKDSALSYAVIRETVEPTVLHKGKIIKKGKVIVVDNN
jgi:hypothetical protein